MFSLPARSLLLVALATLLTACSGTPPLPPQPAASQPTPALLPPSPAPKPGGMASSATPQPSSEPAAPAPADPLAALAAARMAPRDLLALGQAFQGLGGVAPTVGTAPRLLAVGESESFWLIDRGSQQHYSSTFTLRYAGPIALLYVEQGVEVDQEAVERNGKLFEQDIYPRDRALFGSEWSPGVDGDPRLTILLANLPGVGGYFSSSDSLPRAANRYSNERETFYINVGTNPGPTLDLRSVLAHEFQHMIHWNRQRGSPAWFNEGLSTLAEDLNGVSGQSVAQSYLREPDLQLTGWTYSSPTGSAHYGAAQLFLRYVHEHYAGDEGLAPLIAANAGTDTAAFARLAQQRRGDVDSFAALVGDWAVANLLNDPAVADGRFAYTTLPGTVTAANAALGEGSGSAHQFGADYLLLPPGPLRLRFEGAEAAQLLAAQPSGRFAWWGNAGDNGVATLTHPLDLRSLNAATLEFDLWHEIEGGYDYAYVSASTDGGATWQALPGQYTATGDPHGSSLGPGYTGISGAPEAALGGETRGQWLRERVDLTPYAGRELLLRFWNVTDDAEHGMGLLVDNVAIPELGWADDAEAPNGWQAEGFVRTPTALPQRWELRLVRQGPEGTSVERLRANEQGDAEATVAPGELATLVVLPVTPFAAEPASYRYDVATQ